MAPQVAVRFVPKNRIAAPRANFEAALTPGAAADLTPEHARAMDAQRTLASLNMSARVTERNRVETRMPVGQFKETFGVDVKFESSEVRKSKRKPHSSLTQHERFLKPTGALPVPDALKETIDYAYVPRPVEYYGVSYIPPSEKVYHLDLQSVALALNAVRCHRETWTGTGTKVAIVDSGFTAHPFFEQGGYKIIRLGAPGVADPTHDDSGHGTGESSNILAVAPSVTLICVKQGDAAAAALETAVAQQPDVMTNSWGWSADTMSKDQLRSSDPNLFNEFLDIETIIADAVNQGIAVCFSAGNGHYSFPASLPPVIACGGTTVMPDGSLIASSYASSFASKLFPGRNVPDVCGIVGEANPTKPQKGHIMLPVPANSELDGENFAPQRKGEGWGIFSGTSAASPQIAGVVALMKSINKTLKPDQIRSILASSAIDVTAGRTAMGDRAAAGADLATGAGFVDAYRACKSAGSIV